jgi:hypothetical protein
VERRKEIYNPQVPISCDRQEEREEKKERGG